ncbi:M56 family metallopeptidase [Aureisphaera sp. CAU 1614]|uniref:M56 family metallopeptidase n=1 Tax=Halomarinibacterium sedimenti TaxID=2857106 RepID=A0A9X1FMG8_9FLAO|nr:M56 family metallopeptidase [Halomarinibacterium sedimenti]MBW2936953.1 M56 family metallopeptidase [Halomarinibacterium sedimenti]
MISYFIQIIVFQLLLLGVYDLFLKRETFFQLNRVYLLFTPIFIMMVPFLKFEGLQNTLNSVVTINLPEILVSNTTQTISTSFVSSEQVFQFIWLTGIAVSLYYFVKKLNRIHQLKKQGEVEKYSDFTVVYIPNTDVAFTFLKSIFLGEYLTQKQKEDILLHEAVHARQNHTIDLLIYEILKIVFWFNPLFYLFQKRVSALQEFIADASVVQQIKKRDYYENLLSKLFQTETISFINTFFNHSLIKKRIVMLQKSKSTKKALVKYLAVLPIIGAMVIYTSCVNEVKGNQTATSKTPITETAPQQDKELTLKDIDKVPVYPGCEGMSNEEAKKCFTQNVAQHVVKEFSKDIKNAEITGRQKIVVQFVIDSNGEIKDVTAKSDFKELQDEAIRVGKTLPKMIPGEHKGKKVAVQFALPILFEI